MDQFVHDIDEAERKRKRKREKQEKKMKKAFSPQKKSCVLLDTMESLIKKEEEQPKEDVPSKYKGSKRRICYQRKKKGTLFHRTILQRNVPT